LRLAAIDIGSNAIRLQITRIITNKKGEPDFKKLEYIRFPLRLGKDTFQTGEISFRSEAKFIKLMSTFKNIIDLYEVDDFYGCATSAMRDAKNGIRILERSYQQSGLYIDLISGDKEASILNTALNKYLDNKNDYILIDVGGGSTEISIIENNIVKSRSSFKLGSVRNMQNKDEHETWSALYKWLKSNIKTEHDYLAVGTGGNIKTLKEFINKKEEIFNLSELKRASDYINSFSIEERVKELKLRQDRADVISFASKIYLDIMEITNCKKVIIPDIGLKDGIIQSLYKRNSD